MLPFSLTNWESWLNSKTNDPFCWGVFAWSLHQGVWAEPQAAGWPEGGCWAQRTGGRDVVVGNLGNNRASPLPIVQSWVSIPPSFGKHQCVFLESSLGLSYTCPHLLKLRLTLTDSTLPPWHSISWFWSYARSLARCMLHFQ